MTSDSAFSNDNECYAYIVYYDGKDGIFTQTIPKRVLPFISSMQNEGDVPDWLLFGVMMGLFEREAELFSDGRILNSRLEKEVVLGILLQSVRDALADMMVGEGQVDLYHAYAPMLETAMASMRSALIDHYAY